MSAREETWERLRSAGLVDGEAPAPEKTDSPWYVRAMLGVAGWIGALFLLGFVGAGLAFVFRDDGAALIAGLLCCAAALAVLWLNEFHWAARGSSVRAIAYGLTLGLIQVDGQLLFGASSGLWHGRPHGLEMGHWIGPMLADAALVWTVLCLLRRYAISPRSRIGLASIIATTIIATASIQAPGVNAALLVIILGFANANRPLFGLGVIALLVYLSHFYYLLDITLLMKSGVLAGTGCALLAARYAMSVLFPRVRKEQDNA